jgi:hypothetical protein
MRGTAHMPVRGIVALAPRRWAAQPMALKQETMMGAGQGGGSPAVPEGADGPRLTSCPNCSTPRTGQFRYCRVCGLDFDVAERSAMVGGVWHGWSAPSGPDTAGSSETKRLSAARDASLGDQALSSSSFSGRVFSVGGGQYRVTLRAGIWAAIAVAIAAAALVSAIALILR